MKFLHQLFASVALRLGLNPAISFALATRLWQIVAGPVTIFLVAIYFSPEEQGFYYTFGSILALQIFLELGVSFVIIQFSSHEFVHLSWGNNGALIGTRVAIASFLDFLSGAVTWYLYAAASLLVLVLPAGLFFLSANEGAASSEFTWREPWYTAVLFASLSLAATPFLAAIEGGGRVAEIYKLRLMQAICSNTLTWGALIAGGGLYCIAINLFGNALVALVWLWRTHFELIQVVLSRLFVGRQSPQSGFSWKHDVWPFQWRIALSWMAGYFIFQMFVPIVFHYHGPKVAGQMGMTLTVATFLTTISMSWINTSLPIMGKLVAGKRWQELDQVFKRILFQSLAVFLIGGVAIIASLWMFSDHPIARRLLPVSQTAIFLGSSFLSHIIGGLASYLRAHKREPFTAFSVIGATLMVIVVWPLAKQYSSFGVVVGSLLVNLLYGLPSAFWLWKRLRSAWHSTRCL